MAKVGIAKKEPGFLAQVRGFSYVYWLANWMELVERFAYYGVRVVLPVFMVAAFEEGGPQFTHIQKGEIYGLWAIVQSFVPIFSGPFADRYGYKVNIAVSTILKIIGYLMMGYAIPMAEWLAGMPLAEARPLAADHAYEIFFAGAMFLALGTAIFKPGLQGLIANQIKGRGGAASLGWGLFYQMVNIGGFIGPLIAGYLRVLEWEYVFLLCAAGISLNFAALFFFEEPSHHGAEDSDGPLSLLWRAVQGLLEPRLFFFTVSFAGFWLMFYQLFDLLPNFIDDWVDSREPASWLIGLFGEDAVPTVHGGNLTQEWMINFNAALISVFAFAMGYLTGKVRSLSAILVGIAISAVGIYGLGVEMSGWWCLGMIAIFSLGEMAASPTKMRYLASIAPSGREGQYMGYVNMTVGLGWSVGSILGGHLYQERGDKIVLARRYLEEHAGIQPDVVQELPQGDVLEFFQASVGLDAWETRQLLWETYSPNSLWEMFMWVGVGSMIAIGIYTYVARAANKRPSHSFNVHGHRWVQIALVPVLAILAYACVQAYSLSLLILSLMFGMLLVVSSFSRPEPVVAGSDEG